MAHVFRSFIIFLLIIHLGALFIVVQNRVTKIHVRQFFSSVTVPKESPLFIQKKPKIPLRILSPMAKEEWAYQAGHLVPLTANKPARWMVDQVYIGEGKTVFWPMTSGTHFVNAVHEDREQGIYIFIK